jgi:hypothetical protein
MEKKKRGEKGSEVGGGSIGGSVARAERKKGVQGSAPHGGKNGREGVGLSDVDRHGTDTVGGTRLAGAGARLRQGRTAGRDDAGASG